VVNFPTSLDSFSDPSGVGVQGLTTPTHSGHHQNHNDAIEALEAKLGIGASVAAANTVLRGTGAGASGFGAIQTADIAANAVSRIWTATVTATFPSTTALVGSGTVLMTDMSVSITTVGGPILCLFECISNNSAAGNVNVFDLFVGGILQTRRQLTAPVAGYDVYLALLWSQALAAGTYTVQANWAVTAGTATSIGNQRSLTVVELRR